MSTKLSNNACTAMALTEIMDGSESESECAAARAVPKPYAYTKANKRDALIGKVALGLMVAVVLLIGIMVSIMFVESRAWTSSQSPSAVATATQPEQSAFYAMNRLRSQPLPFSKQDNDSFLEAFHVFDQDKDAYLNEQEFATYFQYQIAHSSQFEAFDADNDGIISYPEAVTYEQKINEIETVREKSLDANLVSVIAEQYGFEYRNASHFDVYLQYLVILMYFQQFDVDINGYIHHDEYVRILAKNELHQYDTDNDGRVSANEFYDILYGDDEYSWKGHLNAQFGAHTDETMHALAQVSVTVEAVKSTKVQVCPMQILREMQVASDFIEDYSKELARQSVDINPTEHGTVRSDVLGEHHLIYKA
eukprot:CAMPEP_0197031234 /NCGR_PEP_ID=MMETSP1384-20130603/10301_1 /TAXON_ID=29189 /ORGANISM="Ammonia sp." /LENGTH=364 /DNA_ID=CAMNT_0042460737 /DNA_START=122 /DNA_END=1217 /DNA_ORIENTATION=+